MLAGGVLPYASMRFAELARVFGPDAADPEHLLASSKRFYFDTALSSGPALPTLEAFATHSRIAFGSDFPYAPPGIVAPFTAGLDADNGLTADQHNATNHRNAQALFPRLAPQSDTGTTQHRGTVIA